jgi:predicted DsbA family dithiol-disulfide isomerase
LNVVFRAFPLHPETPAAGLTLEALFAGRPIDIPAAQQRMTRLMQAEGLPYGERTMTYNSRLAQELAAWAVTLPQGDAIHNALFKAYFVEGMNLAKQDVLFAIATRIGLSAEGAREAITMRSFKEVVDGDWQRSRQLGITGVPTFVCNGQRIVGAQPYETLAQLVSQPE